MRSRLKLLIAVIPCFITSIEPTFANNTDASSSSETPLHQIAKSITVRIEGATQGSGVLVEKRGGGYKVLTAWHVIKHHRKGDELDVITPDGKTHSLIESTINQLEDVDLATFEFRSRAKYEVAKIGKMGSVVSGNDVYVSGFPLPTSSVPVRIWRFLEGDVIANATIPIPDGYQLLYSNPTLPGMSGGSVLNKDGELIGIHGRAEVDSKLTEQEGVAVKTGTNQAIPISYYDKSALGGVPKEIFFISFFRWITQLIPQQIDFLDISGLIERPGLEQKKKREVENLLVKAKSLLEQPGVSNGGSAGNLTNYNGNEDKVIELTQKAIDLDPYNYTAWTIAGAAYSQRPGGYGRCFLKAFKEKKGIFWAGKNCKHNDAVELKENLMNSVFNLKKAIDIKPTKSDAYSNLAAAYEGLSVNDKTFEILAEKQLTKAIELSPADHELYLQRAKLRGKWERTSKSCNDFLAAASYGNFQAIKSITAFKLDCLDEAKSFAWDADLLESTFKSLKFFSGKTEGHKKHQQVFVHAMLLLYSGSDDRKSICNKLRSVDYWPAGLKYSVKPNEIELCGLGWSSLMDKARDFGERIELHKFMTSQGFDKGPAPKTNDYEKGIEYAEKALALALSNQYLEEHGVTNSNWSAANSLWKIALYKNKLGDMNGSCKAVSKAHKLRPDAKQYEVPAWCGKYLS